MQLGGCFITTYMPFELQSLGGLIQLGGYFITIYMPFELQSLAAYAIGGAIRRQNDPFRRNSISKLC
jgi:hypothetical protein